MVANRLLRIIYLYRVVYTVTMLNLVFFVQLVEVVRTQIQTKLWQIFLFAAKKKELQKA